MKKNMQTVYIMIAVMTAVLIAGGILLSRKRAVDSEEVKKAVIGTQWYYDDEGDRKHIYFGSDGAYAYWCSCGNGVDGHDIYERYEFTGKAGEIKVTGSGRSEILKVLSYTDTRLVLQIGDKKVEFQLEEE